MIIYNKTKNEFLQDVESGNMDGLVLYSYVRETGHTVNKSQQQAWRESMNYMERVMRDPEIPTDSGVAIEYIIPQTTSRIDFILTGKNAESKNSAIIIELKQWSEGVNITDKDGVVNTSFFGEVPHPSYQAWSYTSFLEDYNCNIQKYEVTLKPCAYLHNYSSDNIINNDFYDNYTSLAPVFFKSDAIKLQEFIKKYVKYGDKGELLYLIDKSEIKPSKSLADYVASILLNNKEFILIDTQKVVYESALKLESKSSKNNKNVMIIEGGPGTGKSVIAINLLAELTRNQKNARYVTRNSAPREVYQIKLSGKFTKSRITNLFNSSGSYYDCEPNLFDALIVDEAHRLNEKSGIYNHLGENQIKELINASKFCVFFIDEDQRVTLKDIGTKSGIINWANKLNAKVHIYQLLSQFRCNGSDGYISWLDNVLQIRETANINLDEIQYDIKVFDNPSKLHEEIKNKNLLNGKSRLVAGYCWNWISKKNPILKDIIIGDYSATWNLTEHGQSWVIQPESVSEIGCIHTCQGLELDYVGVIIGPDLIVRNGKVITDASKRANTDQSLKGLKQKMKIDPIGSSAIADMIIKNTYRTLMTRGMKGCYIYCVDPETQQYFKDKISGMSQNLRYTDIPDGVSLNTDR